MDAGDAGVVLRQQEQHKLRTSLAVPCRFSSTRIAAPHSAHARMFSISVSIGPECAELTQIFRLAKPMAADFVMPSAAHL